MYESVIAVGVLIQLIVPGFVFKKTRSRFLVINDAKHKEDTLIGYIVTGIIVTAIIWPFCVLLGLDPFGNLLTADKFNVLFKALIGSPVRWLSQLFVAPLVLAILVTYCERLTWASNLLSRIGLPPVPRHPNALDQACHVHRGKDPIVRIERKSGELVYGRMGPASCVTANSGYPDVYLDAVYFYDPVTNDLVESDTCTGQVVLGSEIATLTFFANPVSTGTP